MADALEISAVFSKSDAVVDVPGISFRLSATDDDHSNRAVRFLLADDNFVMSGKIGEPIALLS